MGRDGWLAPCWRRVQLNQFIPVPLLDPKRCLSGGGDRAGDPPQPPPLPAAPACLCGQNGGQGSTGRLAAPGPAVPALGAQPLSLCRAVPCHAGEKPLQIVTITFAGDLHAGTVFTEEQ